MRSSDSTPAEAEPGLLGRERLAAYLKEKDLLQLVGPVDVQALGGGVSNLTWLVTCGRQRLVVKQALPKLRVSQDWQADPARAEVEAAALGFVATLTPEAVPRVLAVDPERHLLVLEAAPGSWQEWKRHLLAGRADPSVAADAGRVLGRWQRAAVPQRLRADGLALFDQLRLDPYHRTVAARRPDLAPAIGRLVEELTGTCRVLVHGDFSPKNILAGPEPGQLWAIDFEVAHVGHPVFDVAFMCHHLLLKALHRPGELAVYQEAAAAFLGAYLAETRPAAWDGATLARHVGCLVLARVDGKSPVEYLDYDQRQVARQLGAVLLAEDACRAKLDPSRALESMFALAASLRWSRGRLSEPTPPGRGPQ